MTPSMTGHATGGLDRGGLGGHDLPRRAGLHGSRRPDDEVPRRWWDGIEAIDGLEVMGQPHMSVFAVTSKTLDIYAIGKGMEARGWIVFADSHPVPALRYMQSPGHEPYVDGYLADLREVAELVR